MNACTELVIAVMSALARASLAATVIALEEVRCSTLPTRVIVTAVTPASAVLMSAAISSVLIRFSVVVDPLTTTGATGVVTVARVPLTLTL